MTKLTTHCLDTFSGKPAKGVKVEVYSISGNRKKLNSTTIKIFSNFPKDIKKNYKNYLINKLIADFNLLDSKVNLIFSSSKNPFK